MADRYWVGGTGSWTQAGTANWSATSGGVGGASTPTLTDNVIFDANSSSGSYTVTCDGLGGTWQAACLDLTTTAPASGNLTLTLKDRGIINAYGNVSFYAGMIAGISGTGNHLIMVATAPSTLTTNGINLPWIIQISPSTSATLGDALSCVGGDGTLVLQKNTFYGNGKNITTSGIVFNNVYNRSVIPGVATWEIQEGDFSMLPTSTSAIIDITPPATPSDWIIKFTGSSANDHGFDDRRAKCPYGTRSYGVIEFARSGAGKAMWWGDVTFDTIKLTGTARTLQIGDIYGYGYTLTGKNWLLSGSAGNLNTIQTYNSNVNYFVKSGGGIVSVDYISISYSHATPSSQTWYAGTHSTDGGNNTGWSFTNPAVQKSVGGSLSFSGSLGNNSKAVAGITKDPSGNAVGNCTAWLMAETDPIQQVAEGTSDANGNYTLRTAYGSPVRVHSNKSGTPNIQGVSDTITPA